MLANLKKLVFGIRRNFGYNLARFSSRARSVQRTHLGRIPVRTSAPVAQRLEQQTHNLLVRGSNPCGGTRDIGSSIPDLPTFRAAWNPERLAWLLDDAIMLGHLHGS